MGKREWVKAFMDYQAGRAAKAGPTPTGGRDANMCDSATCEWIWDSLGIPGLGHGPTGRLRNDVVLAMGRAREVSAPRSTAHPRMSRILSSKHIADVVPSLLSEKDIFYVPWGAYYDMWGDAPTPTAVDMRVYAQIATGALIDWDQQMPDARLGEYFAGNTFGSVAEIVEAVATRGFDAELTLIGACAEVAYASWASRWSSEWYSLSYEDWRTVCGFDAHIYGLWLNFNKMGLPAEECNTWLGLVRAMHDMLEYGSDVIHGEWANTVKVAATACEHGAACGYTLPYLILEDLRARYRSGPWRIPSTGACASRCCGIA